MNPFIAKLGQGRPLIGLWQALAQSYAAEMCAGAGFDWLLFDGEHAPNTAQTLLQQLQAVSAFDVFPIARVPWGEPVAIKQYLDIGFQTLLVPMVESAEQARQVVSATRFPPLGTRGVASATSRASGFGADKNYLAHAHRHTAVIAQIESLAGLEAVEAITAVDGIDAVFIGPGDLSAGLGHLGAASHAVVQAAIMDCLARAGAVKPVGIFALDPQDAETRVKQGFAFVSVGSDVGLLANGARALLARFRGLSA